MEVIYISNALPKEVFEANHDTIITCAAQKYNTLLASGIVNCGVKVRMLTTNYPQYTNALWYSGNKCVENGLTFIRLPFANIPFIRRFSKLFAVFLYVLFHSSGETVLVCDSLCMTASFAAQLAARIKKIPSVSIVTDIPEISVPKQSQSFYARFFRYIVNKSDGFLFLTKYMMSYFNVKNKPIIVMEGHVDIDAENEVNTLEGKAAPKVCMFAGNLTEENGLQYMMEGFLKASLPNVILEIYGSGKQKDYIVNFAEKNPSIRYCGSLPNEKVVASEVKATLLINPRPSDQIFTRYSFPSKNLEYMASGTPLLTTRLPCIPEDHTPYLFFLDEETADGMAATLKEIFNQPPEELHKFGLRAKEYIISEKNNVRQAAKLIDMIEQMITN